MDRARTASASIGFLLLAALPLHAQTPGGASGHWEGKIQIPNHELAVTVDLARTSAGEWRGSLSIPNSASDVPLAEIGVDGKAVRFVAALPGRTSFEGSLSADAAGVSGTVSNAEGGVPFLLVRVGEANVKVPPPSSRLPREFEGTWEGVVDNNGTSRRVMLKLSAAPDGTAVGTLIAVDHDNQEIPVTTVLVESNELQLDVRAVSGTYRGALDGDGEIITGAWVEPSARLTLIFKRAPHAAR
jgi:hypothetical protein